MHANRSRLARVNPAVKLTAHLAVMLFLMMIADPITSALLWLLSIIVGVMFGGWTMRYIRKRIVPYLGFFLLVFWMLAAFGKGEHVLGQFAWFRITEEGIYHGLTIAFRMLGFVTYGLLFTSTTDTTQLVMSLIHQYRLSPKWGYGLLAGLRFVPLFQSELAQMKAAHKIRGFHAQGKLKSFARYTLPLFTQGIRKAERVAIAMEARGFDGSRNRTYYHTPVTSKSDYVYAGTLFLAVAVITAVSAFSGWLHWAWNE
ncbi:MULTISPECIES: energy-coupling factor transporter transmembrane component T family protein [Aneurinibacillus]|nr:MULTISPECIES: energy-coupling factor transporter transmembrane component T [Aneurinibacillus]